MKYFVLLCIFSAFFFLTYTNRVESQVIYEKYYQQDTILKGGGAGLIYKLNNSLAFSYQAYYHFNDENAYNWGIFFCDNSGNIKRNFDFIKENYFILLDIKKKNDKYYFFSEYNPAGPKWTYYTIPHLLVTDTNFNIISELYDSSYTALIEKTYICRHFIYTGDSIYTLEMRDYFDSYGDYIAYPIISVFNDSARFVRYFETYDFEKEGDGGYCHSFLMSKDSCFIINLSIPGYNQYIGAELIKLDRNGEKVWHIPVNFEGRLTQIRGVIENDDGDYICYGNTKPTFLEDNPNQADTNFIQWDSLFVAKVSQAGEVIWKKAHPLRNNVSFSYQYNAIRQVGKGKYAIWGIFIRMNYVITNNRKNCLIIFDDNGDITYQNIWETSDWLSAPYWKRDSYPKDAIGLGDTIITLNYTTCRDSILNSPNKALCITAIDTRIPVLVEEKQNFSQGNVLIYPNPAQDKINIALPDNETEIIIYNNLGETVFRSFAIGEKSSIDVSIYPNGIYYLYSRNRNMSHYSKFVILR